MRGINKLSFYTILFAFCLVIFSCSDEEKIVEEDPTSPVTTDLEGFYSGEWVNGGILPGISMIIRSVEDSLVSGELYFTRTFISCCSAPQNYDGLFTFVLNGNSISDIQVNTDIVQPACEGRYEGDGTLAPDPNMLDLNMVIINDCFNPEGTPANWVITKVRNIDDE